MRDFKTDPELAARRRGTNAPKAAAQLEVGRHLGPVRPAALDVAGILNLQRVAGNATVVQMLAGGRQDEQSPVLQRESAPEEPTEEEVPG
jgi:hypothetical protein